MILFCRKLKGFGCIRKAIEMEKAARALDLKTKMYATGHWIDPNDDGDPHIFLSACQKKIVVDNPETVRIDVDGENMPCKPSEESLILIDFH
jgi:hypothetical protein